MWQSTRYGLLQHLLCQKLGLFDHVNSQDIVAPCKSVMKFCNTLDALKCVVSEKYSPEHILQVCSIAKIVVSGIMNKYLSITGSSSSPQNSHHHN